MNHWHNPNHETDPIERMLDHSAKRYWAVAAADLVFADIVQSLGIRSAADMRIFLLRGSQQQRDLFSGYVTSLTLARAAGIDDSTLDLMPRAVTAEDLGLVEGPPPEPGGPSPLDRGAVEAWHERRNRPPRTRRQAIAGMLGRNLTEEERARYSDVEEHRGVQEGGRIP